MVRLRNHESHFYVDVLEDLHTFLSKIFALMPWLRLFKNINHIPSRPYDVSTSPLSFIFHEYLLINVREHRRGNQKRTIQRNLQHSVIKKLFTKNQTFVSPSTTLERTMKWTYVYDPFLWNQYHDIPVAMIPFYEINIMISLLLWSRSMKSISWYPCCYDAVLWNQYHDIPVVMIPLYEINIMISLLLWSRSMKSISWYPCWCDDCSTYVYDPILWYQYHDILPCWCDGCSIYVHDPVQSIASSFLL